MKSLQIGVNRTEIEILDKLLEKPEKFKGPGGKMYFGLQNRDFDGYGKWKYGKKIFSDYKPHLLDIKAIYKIKPKKAHSPYGLTPLGICYMVKYHIDELGYSNVKKMIKYLQNYCKVAIPIKKLDEMQKDDLSECFQYVCDVITISKDKVFFNIKQFPSLTLNISEHKIDDPELDKELSAFLLRGLCFSVIDYYHHRMNLVKKRLKSTRSKKIISQLKEEEKLVKNVWLKIPPKIFEYASNMGDKLSYLLVKHTAKYSHYNDWYIRKNISPKGLNIPKSYVTKCNCFS